MEKMLSFTQNYRDRSRGDNAPCSWQSEPVGDTSPVATGMASEHSLWEGHPSNLAPSEWTVHLPSDPETWPPKPLKQKKVERQAGMLPGGSPSLLRFCYANAFLELFSKGFGFINDDAPPAGLEDQCVLPWRTCPDAEHAQKVSTRPISKSSKCSRAPLDQHWAPAGWSSPCSGRHAELLADGGVPNSARGGFTRAFPSLSSSLPPSPPSFLLTFHRIHTPPSLNPKVRWAGEESAQLPGRRPSGEAKEPGPAVPDPATSPSTQPNLLTRSRVTYLLTRLFNRP